MGLAHVLHRLSAIKTIANRLQGVPAPATSFLNHTPEALLDEALTSFMNGRVQRRHCKGTEGSSIGLHVYPANDHALACGFNRQGRLAFFVDVGAAAHRGGFKFECGGFTRRESGF